MVRAHRPDDLGRLHAAVLTWFDVHARPLPWRDRSTSAWGVLVSEVMLQQTPVDRVQPVYLAWMQRWPTPGRLAAEPAGEAIRFWGRLGYPRRALRLHRSAAVIVAEHGGTVPADPAALQALPGVGEYTAAAVAAFAYRTRVPVLDTNVRRVLSRALTGQARPRAHLTSAERVMATAVLPDDATTAARWSAGVMELGALLCRSSAPVCTRCPLAEHCRWRLAGSPADELRRRSQPFTGTDRQARGALMAVLRGADVGVDRSSLLSSWVDPIQSRRALQSLLEDGLAEDGPDGTVRLPG